MPIQFFNVKINIFVHNLFTKELENTVTFFFFGYKIVSWKIMNS